MNNEKDGPDDALQSSDRTSIARKNERDATKSLAQLQDPIWQDWCWSAEHGQSATSPRLQQDLVRHWLLGKVCTKVFSKQPCTALHMIAGQHVWIRSLTPWISSQQCCNQIWTTSSSWCLCRQSVHECRPAKHSPSVELGFIQRRRYRNHTASYISCFFCLVQYAGPACYYFYLVFDCFFWCSVLVRSQAPPGLEKEEIWHGYIWETCGTCASRMWTSIFEEIQISNTFPPLRLRVAVDFLPWHVLWKSCVWRMFQDHSPTSPVMKPFF